MTDELPDEFHELLDLATDLQKKIGKQQDGIERLRKIEEAAKQVMLWLPVEVNYILVELTEPGGENPCVKDVEKLKEALEG